MQITVKLGLVLCIPVIALFGFVRPGETVKRTDKEPHILWQFDTGG